MSHLERIYQAQSRLQKAQFELEHSVGDRAVVARSVVLLHALADAVRLVLDIEFQKTSLDNRKEGE